MNDDGPKSTKTKAKHKRNEIETRMVLLFGERIDTQNAKIITMGTNDRVDAGTDCRVMKRVERKKETHRERETARECVCVRVRESERERKREKEGEIEEAMSK